MIALKSTGGELRPNLIIPDNYDFFFPSEERNCGVLARFDTAVEAPLSEDRNLLQVFFNLAVHEWNPSSTPDGSCRIVQ